VEDWWKESQRAGIKVSTYEGYRATISNFSRLLGHDDARRVTPEDVIAFKDHRIQAGISAKTVKTSDLAALKSIFGWAVANRKLSSNPADGVTVKVPKRQRVRPQGYTDDEAVSLLKAASTFTPGKEHPKVVTLKRWAPWLMAFTGARVGEIVQLRKQDIRQHAGHWVMHITPEAYTQKTDTARDVVIHPQIIERGLAKFLDGAASGYLFMSPKSDDAKDIRGAWRTAKNRLTEAARQTVSDPNVAANHGWRHRFKTVGLEAGISHRVLDAIQGHAPKTQGEAYGDVTLKVIAEAIGRLPRYAVE
jgi:integrase